MKSGRDRSFYAILLREWILMRTWVFSFTLVIVAGPVINLLNMIGAPRSVRLTSMFESVYTKVPLGGIDVINNHIIAVDYRPHPEIFIQGAPPASLWVIAVATALGAIQATIERQTSAITDTLNAPVRKTDWIQAKFFFGTGALVIMVVLRTVVLFLSNTMSPWHFAASTLFCSGVVNLFIALAAFAVVFFMGMLVTNVLLAWCLGFLALALPLSLGAVVRFLGLSQGLLRVAYTVEHDVVLKLSPFWYTDYSTNVIQHFSSSVQTFDPIGSVTDMTMYTAVSHTWVLTVGSIIIGAVLNLCSVRVFARTKVENFGNLFVSSKAFHACLAFVSVIFGSTAAQIFGHASLPVFLVMAFVCYVVLWLIHRQIEVIGARVKRRRTQVA